MFNELRIYRKIKKNHHEDALPLFPEESKMTPRLLLYRSIIFSKLRKFTEAKADHDSIKQSGKYLFYAYNNQGCFYLQQFLVDEALEELKEARKLKPKHSYALNNYGHGLMLKGELEEGVKLIEEAFRIDRWNYTAMRNIGIYYLLKGDYRGALTVLTKAREGDKHVEDIDLYIALGLKKDGNSEKYNSITSMFSTDQMERLAEITKHIPDGYRH